MEDVNTKRTVFFIFLGIFIMACIDFYYRPMSCLGYDGKIGTCLDISKCPLALREGKRRSRCDSSQICCVTDYYTNPLYEKQIYPKSAIIVVKEEYLLSTKPAINETKKKSEVIFLENNIGKDNENKLYSENNQFNEIRQKTDHCKQNNHRNSIERVATRKCYEYQEKYVYPCVASLTPFREMVTTDNCNWGIDSLISDGEIAKPGEFPHMALLGYQKQNGKWLCGGVIVSEGFVLTAAHCTYSTVGGKVTKIRIRTLRRSENIEKLNLYNVKSIHKYPKYKSPLQYDDIALLETDRTMVLDRYALPTCLHDGRDINDEKAIITGWGTTTPGNNRQSDILQKAQLEKFSDEVCETLYKNIHYMPFGYQKQTQLCYGSKHSGRDSCKGDSGGPIQIQHPTVKCMYLVSAIISHGKYCGQAGSPGIYNRVAPYLDWIESIVWPDEA